MISLRYSRTTGQTAKDQFEAQVEIVVETQESDIEIYNAFLTLCVGEREAFNKALEWLPEISE